MEFCLEDEDIHLCPSLPYKHASEINSLFYDGATMFFLY